MGIFDKRVEFKPFEYPHVSKFRDAINHSYWLVNEWNFISDVQDFHTKLTPAEQNTVKNAMLAISQIEVSVKKFWAKLGERFPKAEIDQVGITFGESEVRHESSYSHLLQVLQLNDDFKKLLEIPCMGGRVEYLSKYINNAPQKTNQEYLLTLTLFTIFVENVSLFSQFLVIKSFNKHKNVLKDIDNVIQATRAEEILHAQFGFWLINQVKKEHPEWFTKEFYDTIINATYKAYEAEANIIEWIFEAGDLDFITRAEAKEFIKQRFNESLETIGIQPIFAVDQSLVERLMWFNEEMWAEVNTDFFYKKPTTYSKKMQSVSGGDLF